MAHMAELQTCITTTSYSGCISEPSPFSLFFSNLDLTLSLSLSLSASLAGASSSVDQNPRLNACGIVFVHKGV